MTPSKFAHSESALVSSLGLPRKKISALRGSALVRGVDWAHTAGEVRYSDAGRAKLHELLAIPAPAVAEDLAPKDPTSPPFYGVLNSAEDLATALAPLPPDDPPDHPPRPGEIRVLVCVRTYPLNRRVVQARLGETLVRVRMRTSEHFVPAMELKARFVGADLWELAQRLPRWKGKW
jgi:hypothetical protein